MNTRAHRYLPWYVVLIGGLLSLGVAFPLVSTFRQEAPSDPLSDSPYLRIDPAKIVLSDRDTRVPCGECHSLEYETWRSTPHSTGFNDVHRSDQAQAILDKMGFKLAKRESLCLRCHYTAVIKNDQARAIAGVSCESCHGAARDWIDLHNDYGGADHDTEPEAHKQQRVAQSTTGGMLRPSDNLYAVAANCFECHTVPNEKLINVGGHPSGSQFDLIDWSDQIRHNFVQAQWSSDETNRPRTQARIRVMFVLGRALNYQYSIRAAAEATTAGPYSKAMERRVKVARRDLEKVYRVVPLPAVQSILTRGRDLRLAPNNKAPLLAAADAISTLAQQFAQTNDGDQLAALDPLIAGEVIAAAEEEEEDDPDEDPETPDTPTDDPETPATTDSSGVAVEPGTTTPSTPTVAVVGQARRRPAWFAAAQHGTLGPSAGCSCHNEQFEWWDGDPHSLSAEPLLQHDPNAVQIAETYGLSLSQMKRGNRICMNCHGTIVTGEEAEEIFDGVSCENCHGPGEDYDRKHEEDPPPGPYEQGASFGMVNLEQVAARANNCARCHHITDERLISSGHPTGEGFNLGERNEAIKHWAAPTHSASALNTAYQQAIGRRPVPQNVPIATAALAENTPAATPVGGRTRASSPSRSERTRVTRTRAPRARPLGGGSSSSSTSLGLPPLPAVSDTTSTEDILVIVKQRLEQLYSALGRGQ